MSDVAPWTASEVALLHTLYIEQRQDSAQIAARFARDGIARTQKAIQRKIQHEQRMKQLRSETEQLRQENKRLAELESRMDALLRNADSCSQTPPGTGSS